MPVLPSFTPVSCLWLKSTSATGGSFSARPVTSDSPRTFRRTPMNAKYCRPVCRAPAPPGPRRRGILGPTQPRARPRGAWFSPAPPPPQAGRVRLGCEIPPHLRQRLRAFHVSSIGIDDGRDVCKSTSSSPSA